MLVKKVLFLFLFFTFTAHSQENVSVTKVISVYDGDTFRVDIDELSDIVGKNIAIRILGIDTPEIKGQCEKEKQLAIKARDFTRHYLNNASSIQLSNLKRDKYFRLLADVYVDGKSLAAALLANNLAVRYSGNKKSSWCF
ncbi:MAG: thermonuclease family protein [Woeseiaceae bacterium]|nr:thermonuclease family protein [Woeseiaceae bacterium]|tara:strand:- start:1979 stop:2398 length:420 start_codon:yes stop_codon:yes gene_type:complete